MGKMVDEGSICIPNIGPRERRSRLRFGVVVIGAGALVATMLVVVRAHPLWRFVVFPPFWVGATGIIQAREKT